MDTGIVQEVTASYAERNHALVEEFCKSLPVMSEKRVDKHRSVLRNVQDLWLKKAFDQADKVDLKTVNAGILASDYETWTQIDYCKITKKFFRWLRDEEFVKGFRIPPSEATVGPDEILKDVELNMIYEKACLSLRDKALSRTMYETGARPHEILGLRKNDVAFDDMGAQVHIRPVNDTQGRTVKAKTGGRTVRVVEAAPYLANWMENHPLKPRDAALWIDQSPNSTQNALTWIGLSSVVERWQRTSGIEKEITAYTFRHTRATNLASWMTEAQMCIHFGWKVGSKMPSMYIHLSGRDVEDALLKSYGLKKAEPLQTVKVPKKCGRCGTLCPGEVDNCSKCGLPLSIQAAIRHDEEFQIYKAKVDAIEEAIRNSADGMITISWKQ